MSKFVHRIPKPTLARVASLNRHVFVYRDIL